MSRASYMPQYYSPSRKQEAVDFYNAFHESEGWTAVRVARKFKVNPNTLRSWLNEANPITEVDGQEFVNITTQIENALQIETDLRAIEIDLGLIQQNIDDIRKALHG